MSNADVRVDLPRLTSLRALAALAVFAFHIAVFSNWLPIEFQLRYGLTGVSFFFLLSGFVLAWALRPEDTTAHFYVRRFARIYPLHLVLALAALVVSMTAVPVTAIGILANLTLVQAWFSDQDVVYSLNGVSWSLSCEAFFYLLAPFLILWLTGRSRRTVMIVCLTWATLCGAAALVAGLSGATADAVAYTNPAIRSGEFVLGVMLAVLVRDGWRPRLRLGAALLVVAAVGSALTLNGRDLPHSVIDVILTPCFALVVLAAATDDLTGRPSLLRGRWFVYAGEISFAFYLVHQAVIVNVVEMAGTDASTARGVGLSALALVGAALTAVILHELAERPCQRTILRAWRGRVRATSAGAP